MFANLDLRTVEKQNEQNQYEKLQKQYKKLQNQTYKNFWVALTGHRTHLSGIMVYNCDLMNLTSPNLFQIYLHT